VYKGRPDKQGAHRALDDIRESLDEMRYYRAHMLRAPEHDEATPEHPGTDSDGATG